MLPSEIVHPIPEPTCPRGPGSRKFPNMNPPRRIIAVPASTFSETASIRNRSGAQIGIAPSARSSTPRTPPKWSPWLCE